MTMLPKPVSTAIKMLEEAGYEAYIVGGCMRDRLLGEEPGDYDITTSALPEEAAKVFERYRVIGTGLKHGTQTVIIDEMPLEITTFRVEGTYSDSRHPDSVSFTRSLREDVMRRDFTMNAIAGTGNGDIIDFCGGKEDIGKGIIRCVGEPEKRFTEDALRIMRALRFSSVLGFEIEEKTKAAAFSCMERLRYVSAERIYAELIKLLCGKNVRRVLLEYTDILGVVLPELLPMKNLEQHNPHHIYDVLEHTAAAVESIPPEPVLRMAALLHDVGKPDCFSMDDKGIGHFYGHADRSAELADEILCRLKTDTALRLAVTELVKYHGLDIKPNEKIIKRRLRTLSEERFFQLLWLMRADTAAQAPEYSGRIAEYNEAENIAKKIMEEGSCFSLRQLKVNGDDLLAAGFSKGKQMGELLNKLLDAVINGAVKNEKDALLEYAKKQMKARK